MSKKVALLMITLVISTYCSSCVKIKRGNPAIGHKYPNLFKGKNGRDGKDGKDGIVIGPLIKGQKGEKGKNGSTGVKGQKGIFINAPIRGQTGDNCTVTIINNNLYTMLCGNTIHTFNLQEVIHSDFIIVRNEITIGCALEADGTSLPCPVVLYYNFLHCPINMNLFSIIWCQEGFGLLATNDYHLGNYNIGACIYNGVIPPASEYTLMAIILCKNIFSDPITF